MANPLTGDFDAVVQVSLRQLNALLATLHQNGAASETALKLLHSASMRIGDPPPQNPDLVAFGDWVLDVQAAGGGIKPGVLKDQLAAAAPPGVAGRFRSSFTIFDPSHLVDAELEVLPVKGRADVQISSVRLGVESGATSEVAIHAEVRARYRPDPGTTPLPEFISGHLRAVFKVKKQTLLGRTRLIIQPSPVDQQIEFTAAAGSGLSAGQAASVGVQIRKALREGLLLLPVDLPKTFPFSEFKGVGTGTTAALALPIQLSDRVPAPGAIAGITDSVVQGHGFAFGVSKEHVVRMIDVEAIRAAVEAQSFTLSIGLLFGSVSATYRLRFSSGPVITFESGSFTVAGRVEAETSAFFAPNGFVQFKQKLRLRLNVAKQEVSLGTVGEPVVDKSFFIPHSRAVSVVKSTMADALEANGPAVSKVFDDARDTLVSGLRHFDTSASATYADIDIAAAGVVIQGALTTASRPAPVVHVADADQGASFSAFQSWIPGGHLERFTWSWVEYPPHSVAAWSGVTKLVSERHRFILPKPPGITDVSSICLRIDGTRTRPDGVEEAASGGTLCLVAEPVLSMKLPPWWEPLTVPVWAADLGADAVLADSITAHVSVQSELPPQSPARTVVVYFPDWDSPDPLDLLHRALAGVPERGLVPAAALVVVPPGALNVSRREFEAKLGPLGVSGAPGARDTFGARGTEGASRSRVLHVTEDAEGGWTRTFGAAAKPALFIVDGRRECAWKSVGSVDPAAAAAAIAARTAATPGPRFRPLAAKVVLGQRAPDVGFRDDRGEAQALHRLRGQRVVFIFWQAWSAPSLAELQRVAQRHAQDPSAGTVVAFHGGPPRKGFDDLRKQLGVSFAIVQDDEHRVARAFGVRCWPTTIEIDAGGLIDRIRLGVDRHEHGGAHADPHADAGHCDEAP